MKPVPHWTATLFSPSFFLLGLHIYWIYFWLLCECWYQMSSYKSRSSSYFDSILAFLRHHRLLPPAFQSALSFSPEWPHFDQLTRAHSHLFLLPTPFPFYVKSCLILSSFLLYIFSPKRLDFFYSHLGWNGLSLKSRILGSNIKKKT